MCLCAYSIARAQVNIDTIAIYLFSIYGEPDEDRRTSGVNIRLDQ